LLADYADFLRYIIFCFLHASRYFLLNFSSILISAAESYLQFRFDISLHYIFRFAIFDADTPLLSAFHYCRRHFAISSIAAPLLPPLILPHQPLQAAPAEALFAAMPPLLCRCEFCCCLSPCHFGLRRRRHSPSAAPWHADEGATMPCRRHERHLHHFRSFSRRCRRCFRDAGALRHCLLLRQIHTADFHFSRRLRARLFRPVTSCRWLTPSRHADTEPPRCLMPTYADADAFAAFRYFRADAFFLSSSRH